MKKITLISAIAICGLLFKNNAEAQIRIRLGLNIAPHTVVAVQPSEYMEPAGYQGDEDYYYLPEVDAYYSIPEQCYYYNDGGAWVSAAFLPGAYHDFDWRSAARFEVRAPRPFLHDDYYRSRYNGVNLGGHWNGGNNRVYANNDHFDRAGYSSNDQRSFNQVRGADNRLMERGADQHFDNRGERNHNFDRGTGQEHFARNSSGRGDGDHRSGKF